MPNRSRASRFATLLFCLAVAGLEGYDIQAFGVAAPHMTAELKIGAGAQGLIASATMVGLAIGAMAASFLSERFGRSRVLACSIAVFGAFSILTAKVEAPAALFLVRLLAGTGFGGAMPNIIATVLDVASEKRRTLTVTAVFCGLPAGASVVALAARGMGATMDWRLIFVIGGLIPIALAPLALLLVRGSQSPAAKTHSQPMRDLFGEGRAVSTLLIWSTFAITLLVVYLMLNWLPTLAISKGLSAADGATAAMVFNVASVVGALALAATVDRFGFRWPLFLDYLLLAAVVALMAVSERADSMLVLSTLAGFLVVGPQCVMYALIPWIYPGHARVLGSGGAIGVGRIGSIIGPLIAGQLREVGYSANEVFLVIAPLPLVAAVAVFFLGKRRHLPDATFAQAAGAR